MMNPQIISVLGPTNTGKTHFAVERMLQFETGVIGFPLRLLAREVYDNCVKKLGSNRVALITGEEKIIPPTANYYLCTVESMPLDLNFEFVAIDEIQMCADPERGHIFTDRLLNYRGDKLTMFLGADTMKNIISNLVPSSEFVYRDRLSKLIYTGYKKISRIQPRSAIVAFSVDEVYALAEFIRRQRGGAAIVMGSLSPKTRNAQVDLYQSGDVDFLVATDAIGMGINMNIDHVSFSNLRKYDGKKIRGLRNTEIGQISGRAGRYKNDGSFGITGDCEALTSEQIEKLENHKFDSVINIYWRNSSLDFSSIKKFIESLNKLPSIPNLLRNRELIDENMFKFLTTEKSQLKIKNEENHISKLWECCQIPDFTKSSYNEHMEIVTSVFNFLTSDKEKITNDWMKKQVSNLDNLIGNIDAIANRISHVRTWSYVANKRNWVENNDYWIAKTKDIEDKLSDRLHEELSKSFVDKRISILSRGLKQDIQHEAKISENNEIIMDGQLVGKINGLKIILDYTSNALQTDIRSIKKAARNGAALELKKRIEEIIASPEHFSLKKDKNIYWKEKIIGKIYPGKNYLNPDVKILVDESVELQDQQRISSSLSNWLKLEKQNLLQDLIKIENSQYENRFIRGLCYQLFENNGVLKRENVNEIVKQINKEDRSILRKLGIKIGRYHIYQPRMVKPAAVNFKTILWNCFHNLSDNKSPAFGLNFVKNFTNHDKEYLLICGFETFDNYIIRIDILERLFLKIISLSKNGLFELTSDILNLLGSTKEDFKELMKKMNYNYIEKEGKIFFKYSPKKFNSKISKKKVSNNPFSELKKIKILS
ncbi:MAG: helicase-related protein [Proteobacteria bacterium]|nr:helicase-related protein [Pseudomonadota bacterium]